jgi:hypothetical protein
VTPVFPKRARRLPGPALAAALLACLPAAAPARAEPMEEKGTAVLQALDKVTARVQELEVPVGGSVGFGAITITVRTCRKATPIDPPESVAFLEIDETRPDEADTHLFSGWMFASSPALSPLEHPVYDVWVLDCK